MKKFFTKMSLMGAFLLVVAAMNAQTIVWPTSDSASIRASQFADASTIRYVKKDTVLNTSLNGFKNWVTIGITSANAAKSDSAVWFWTPTGAPNVGSYVSATADTRLLGTNESLGLGAALFSSDFLDSRGTAVDAAGQAPGEQTGELWSPVFDATGSKDLSISFQQTNRHFQSSAIIPCFQSTAVSWSEDGGVTWKPIICIEENEGYGLYERLPRNTPTVIKLKGSVGTSKFRVKFYFSGDYYYWLVDDVKVGVWRNNVTANKSFVVTPNYVSQRNNIDSSRFMVDVTNNGTVPARNVKVTVDVLNNATLATVFTTTRNLGTVAPDSTVENELLPQSFLAPTTIANYDVRYRISHDSTDMFQRDDSIYFRTGLLIRDSTFRNDHGNPNPLGYAPGSFTSSTRAWKLGQYYYFPRGATSTATKISAYVETAASVTTARTYVAGLYEWKDTNNNDSVEVGERKLVAFGEGSIPIANANNFLDVRLENFIGSGPVYLKDNQAYLAMFEITPTVANTTWFGYFDDRDRYGYGAYKFATRKAGKPRYMGVIDVNGSDANSVWRTSVFGGTQYQPRVTLTAWPIRIGTKDDLPASYKINIYPNPVAGANLSVNLDFPKSEEAVLLRVFDLKGQLIQEREYSNVQKETVNMDINKLANGNYLLQVQTMGNQAKTLKFMKVN